MKEYPLTSSLPVSASSPWIGTALASGTFAQTTDLTGGVAVLSGAATTDNSGVQIQCDMEAFSFHLGKKTHFQTYLKCSDGTQDEWAAGLGITDTTFLGGGGSSVPDATGLSHSDSVVFYKPDGSTSVYGCVMRDSTLVYATPGYPITAPTSFNHYYWVMEMDGTTAGTGIVKFWVNEVPIGTSSISTVPYDAEEYLTPTLAFVTGDASGTKTLTCDFIYALQER